MAILALFCKTPSSGFSKHFSSNLSAIADHVTLRDCTVIGSCGQRQNASPFWLVDPLNCAVHGVQYTSHLSLNNLFFLYDLVTKKHEKYYLILLKIKWSNGLFAFDFFMGVEKSHSLSSSSSDFCFGFYKLKKNENMICRLMMICNCFISLNSIFWYETMKFSATCRWYEILEKKIKKIHSFCQ